MGDVKETIAKNILFYRRKRKLSQRELSEKIGVNGSAISNWENGINSIDIETLFKVCDALDISLNTVFGVEEKGSTQSLESEHTKKYNKLDSHGKRIVNDLIDAEIERIMAEKQQAQNKAKKIENKEYAIQKYIIPRSRGKDIPLDHSETQTIHLNSPPPKGSAFAIEVENDAMEPLYYAGDLVFVRPQPTIEKGQIGVFYHKGEVLIRELAYGKLICKSPKYSPIMASECTSCFGRVMGSNRVTSEKNNYEYRRIARSSSSPKSTRELTKDILDNLKEKTNSGELNKDYDI